MAEPDITTDSRSTSWPAEVAMAVATGVVTTYLPVQRWRRSAQWTLHGGMGTLAAGAMGAFLAAPGPLVDPTRQDEPPFTMSPGAKAGVAVGFGALVTAVSRSGQSADEWAERALTARGVRRPRLWMGVVAAGASWAVGAADRLSVSPRDLRVHDVTGRS